MTSAFAEMIELAVKVGIRVRHVHLGGAGGGLAKLRGERQVFIDVDADPADQVASLAAALASQEGLDAVFVRPDVRELIERHR